MTKFVKLSDEGKVLASSMKQGSYVRIREVGERVLPKVSYSGAALRRLVEAFQSLPERSRNLTSVESLFAQVEEEFQSPFAWDGAQS